MDGAASEAVRGLKAEKDSDLALIWEALSRRFGFVDEPERAIAASMLGSSWKERRWPCSSRVYACCIGKPGRRRTSSHPRPTRYYAGSSSTASSTLNFRGTSAFTPPATTSPPRCLRRDSSWTPTSCRALQRSQPSALRRPTSTTRQSSTECWRPWSCVIENVWRMSTLSRRPVLRLLPPVTETRRRRPAKVRRRRATRPPGVPPAVHRQLAYGSVPRPGGCRKQAIGATSRVLGAVGATTSHRKATAAVPGHGWIAVRQGRSPLAFAPHRRDGHHARVVLVVRRHNRDGRQGKGAHVIVPGPRAIQATGGPVGGRHQAIAVVRRRRSNDAGATV